MALDTAEKLRFITNIVTRGSSGKPDSGGLDERAMANGSLMYLLDEDYETVPLTNIMTLYPIQPTTQGNTIVYRKGNSEWVSVQKSTDLWRAEVVTLRHKGTELNMKLLYNFLVDFKGTVVTLTIDGVQPFIRATETNNVKIISFSQMQRILPQYWEISVTYRCTDVN